MQGVTLTRQKISQQKKGYVMDEIAQRMEVRLSQGSNSASS
jgi:hypothetical protein